MVTTRRLQLVLTMAVALTAVGCKDDPKLNFLADLAVQQYPDLAGADLTGVVQDFTVVPDLAEPPDLIGADLTAVEDLTVAEDLTAEPDLLEADFAVDPNADMVVVVPPDMTDTTDMTPEQDLLPGADMVPGFGVVSATATSATTVEVTFTDAVNDTTVVFGDFTISGLTISAATVAGNKVTLTTNAQSEAVNYQVEVTGEVLDATNRTITAGNSAAFTGFVPPAPSITTLAPTSVIPGVSSLVITGTAFQAATGTTTVTIGGVAQTITSNTGTVITIAVVDGTTPVGATQPVVVTTDDGNDSENIEVLGEFRMESVSVLTTTTVAVTFNRAPDPLTVSAARFSAAGLTVDSAVAAGAVVTLTFSTPIVDATAYALYVTADLKDTFGIAASASHIVMIKGAAPTEFVVAAVNTGASLTAAVRLERRSIANMTTVNATLSFPSAAPGIGDPQPFTVTGNGSAEAVLSRSPDGKVISLLGYQAASGVMSPPLVAANVPRIAAIVDSTDFVTPLGVNYNVNLGTVFNNSRASSAVVNGDDIWVVGGAGGIFHGTISGNGGFTSIANPVSTGRQVAIFAGQLYYSASGAPLGVYKIGTGLPTTTTTGTIIDSSMSGTGLSAVGFSVFDVNGAEAGPDLVYTFDDGVGSTAGIKRYTKSGGVWTQSATFTLTGAAVNPRHGVCYLDGVDDDAVCIVSGSLGIVTLRDAAHASAGGATLVNASAAPPSGTQFRGLTFAPQP